MSSEIHGQLNSGRSATNRGYVTELRERAEIALDTLTAPPTDFGTELLEQRAQDLARRTDESIDTDDLTDVVVFHVGLGTYAIETTHTHHIVRVTSLAPIPGCDSYLKGVCLYGGEIVPVFDISTVLGETTNIPATNAWAILLGESEIEVAVVVDRVDTLTTIRTNELEKLSRAALISEAGKFIEGTLPSGLTLISAARLLEHETMRISR